MRASRRLLAVLLAACLIASGCIGSGPKSKGGGLIGATGGGLLAAAAGGGTAGILAGVLLGGLAGSAIGDSLDQRDREIAAQTAQRSLERARANTTSEWQNPDSGNSGSITPIRTFQNAGGEYCREYQQVVTVGGKSEQLFGTACREADGNWRVSQ